LTLSNAAGEHFADAERILAALPIVKRSADRDRRVQITLVHATLAVAAGVLGATVADQEPPASCTPRVMMLASGGCEAMANSFDSAVVTDQGCAAR
jgi:hypothetical protein